MKDNSFSEKTKEQRMREKIIPFLVYLQIRIEYTTFMFVVDDVNMYVGLR